MIRYKKPILTFFQVSELTYTKYKEGFFFLFSFFYGDRFIYCRVLGGKKRVDIFKILFFNVNFKRNYVSKLESPKLFAFAHL
jgi:hypothetical protein